MRRNDVGAILVIATLYAGMQLVGITCPSSLKYPVGYLTVWFQVILSARNFKVISRRCSFIAIRDENFQ